MLFMPRSAAAEEIAADVRRTALAIQACPSMVDKQRHYEIEAERAKRFNAHFGIRPAPVLTPVAGKPHFFTNERGQLSYCPPLPPTAEESAAQQPAMKRVDKIKREAWVPDDATHLVPRDDKVMWEVAYKLDHVGPTAKLLGTSIHCPRWTRASRAIADVIRPEYELEPPKKPRLTADEITDGMISAAVSSALYSPRYYYDLFDKHLPSSGFLYWRDLTGETRVNAYYDLLAIAEPA